MVKYRVVTGRSNDGIIGFVAEKKGWFFWRGLSNLVQYSIEEAKREIQNHKIKLGVVVYEDYSISPTTEHI